MNLKLRPVFLCMINQMRPGHLSIYLGISLCLHFSCLKSLMDAQMSSSLSIFGQHLTPLKPISPRSTKDACNCQRLDSFLFNSSQKKIEIKTG